MNLSLFSNSPEHDLIIFFCLGFSILVILFMYSVSRLDSLQSKLDRRDALKKQLILAKSLTELADLRYRRPHQSARVYNKHKDSLKKRRERVYQLTKELEAVERDLGMTH